MRFLFTIFLFFFNLSLYSQITLSGYIQEEGSGERLPYSNVYIPDIEKGSSANENGSHQTWSRLTYGHNW